MHQLPDGGLIPIGTIHIENMRTIPKPFAALDEAALDLIDSFPQADHIILGEEDDKGFRQGVKVFSFFQKVDIHHAAVIPCPFSACAFV